MLVSLSLHWDSCHIRLDSSRCSIDWATSPILVLLLEDTDVRHTDEPPWPTAKNHFPVKKGTKSKEEKAQ